MDIDQINILIVDDVSALRSYIKELLKSFGYCQISVASNVPEASRILEEREYQLILCDWHMQPVDGLNWLRMLRTNSKSKSIPFIMITAEKATENVMKAIGGGVDDYLLKPLTAEQIRVKVNGLLIRKGIIKG